MNHNLTSSFDFGRTGILLPGFEENCVDQAVSPDRIKACQLGVRTRYLSTGDEAMGKILGSKKIYQEYGKASHQYQNPDVLSSSAASSSGLSVWMTSLGSNQEEISPETPARVLSGEVRGP